MTHQIHPTKKSGAYIRATRGTEAAEVLYGEASFSDRSSVEREKFLRIRQEHRKAKRKILSDCPRISDYEET